jgi:hypothetical protein
MKHTLLRQEASIKQLEDELNDVKENLRLAESEQNEKQNEINRISLEEIAGKKDDVQKKVYTQQAN